MAWPPTGAHRIRTNESSRMPRRFIILDTEGDRAGTAGGEVQTWLCGVTSFDEIIPRRKTPKPTQWAEHATPAALWDWVDARCTGKKRTVLVAHNLGYDLRVSRAVPELVARGWELERIRLEGSQTWARFTKDGHRLVMVDLFSWLLVPLDDVAAMVGMVKLPLPAAGDELAAHMARCRRDVEITREAWLQIMGWLEREDLGTWQMTGAGQATAAWRHRFHKHKVIATMDEARHDIEREAGWAGRCEAWKWGKRPHGRYTEWDLPSCYGTVARDEPVPVYPLDIDVELTPELIERCGASTTFLARVEVTTDLPLVPARREDRILWPVGRFETTLWLPELKLLLAAGAGVRVIESWPYRLMPALSSFAAWALDIAAGDADDHPPVARELARHWSRALVGRFGMRYRRFEDFAIADRDDCVCLPHADFDTNTMGRLLWVGRRVQIETELVEPPDASPAIMAYVMSLARCRLWDVMATAGLEEVVYCDTDSVIAGPAGSRRLKEATSRGELWGLRVKGVWDSLDVRGPRQLITGHDLRAAGVPRRARANADGTWSAPVWRNLRASFAARETDRVVITDRTFRLRGKDHRREHLPGGETRAIRLGGATAARERQEARSHLA